MVKRVFSFHFIIIRMIFEPRILLRINISLNHKILLKSRETFILANKVCSALSAHPVGSLVLWMIWVTLEQICIKGRNDMSIYSRLYCKHHLQLFGLSLDFEKCEEWTERKNKNHLLPCSTNPKKPFLIYTIQPTFHS